MTKQQRMALFTIGLSVFWIATECLAETFVLKSGKVVTGKMVGRVADSAGVPTAIIVESDGQRATYAIEDIADIKEMHEEEMPSTQPMYGGIVRTPEEQAIDAEFLKRAVQEFGSRAKASEAQMQFGWQYFDQGDWRTAMKRFNQAWLLQPDNADVFWGFGSVALDKRDADQAIAMFEKSISLNPLHAPVVCSLGSAHQLKATQMPSRAAATPHLEESVKYCAQGAALDAKEEFCYTTWAGTLMLQGKYGEAWDKVRAAQRLGGKTVNPDVLHDLSRLQPEPR